MAVEHLSEIPSQEEIMANWGDSLDLPSVSICCITFNHEKFIEQTIAAFLSQKTNFAFEILLHDDASVDRTPDIVREYVNRYPLLLKPVYQTVNQYSKGNMINPSFNFPRAKGKYIAMCEGDDLWIDQNKLQKQYNILENNKSISLCYHPSEEWNYLTGQKSVVAKNYGTSQFDKIEQIMKSAGSYMPTASLFFRHDNNLFQFFSDEQRLPLGDFFIQIISACNGRVYFFDEVMSVYRRNTEGSWSSNIQGTASYKSHARQMLFGINALYKFIDKCPSRDFLAYPYFRYSWSVYVDAVYPIRSLLRFLTSAPPRSFKLKFHILYYMEFIKKIYRSF